MASSPASSPAQSPLVAHALRLRRQLRALSFGAPVGYVYAPLDYAWEPARRYLATYGVPRGQVLLLGMNPGPFGMAQTGVPFGDVAYVRDFLRLTGRVRAPANAAAARPVQGFACPRREVSGSRLWGWAQQSFGTPAAFFDRFFVYNYCPLAFLLEGGQNYTPDKLPPEERAPLFAACDEALRKTLTSLKTTLCVGIGAFAADRLRRVAGPMGLRVGQILHPSPASPLANRGWAMQATAGLRALGLRLPEPQALGPGGESVAACPPKAARRAGLRSGCR